MVGPRAEEFRVVLNAHIVIKMLGIQPADINLLAPEFYI
jgi:hypothetical protein